MKVARTGTGAMDSRAPSPNSGLDTSATSLLDLPAYVLARIALQLAEEDLLSLGKACKHAHEVVHDDTLVWRVKCLAFGIASFSVWRARSFKHLYLGLLHRHRELLGYWAGNVFLMGSFLRVRLVAPCIEGMVATVPCLNGPLSWTKVFEIALPFVGDVAAVLQQAQELDGSQDAPSSSSSSSSDQSSSCADSSTASECDSNCRLLAAPAARQQKQQQAGAQPQHRRQRSACSTNFASSTSGALRHAELRCFRALALEVDGACVHCGSARAVRKPGRQQLYLHLQCSQHCNQPLLELMLRHDPNRRAPLSGEQTIANGPAEGQQQQQDHSISQQQQQQQQQVQVLKVPEIVDRYRCEPRYRRVMLQMFHQVMLAHQHRLEQQRATEFVQLPAPEAGGAGHPLEGVWKGTYGAHGIELVLLRQEGDALVATKVTGDLNVPAGQATFRADLATRAAAADPPACFALPPNYDSDVDLQGSLSPALAARSTYQGLAHVSRPGFESDEWIPAQLVEFGPDCFGLLWFTIDSFSLYSRLELPDVVPPGLKQLPGSSWAAAGAGCQRG